MKEFLGEDFQLDSKTAVFLYKKFAKDEPIFDYHCHLVPQDIYEDRKFKDITEVWLVDGYYGDHYKWRAMRAYGVDEKYITGNASNYEKFMKWAETVPYTIGNPLYLWTHMELRKYFGIKDILTPRTAEKIYQECNRKLETLTTRKMIEMSNVKIICTTDDPVDDLKWHLLLKEDQSFKTKVLPTFRPDCALNIEAEDYLVWLKKLEEISGVSIKSITDLENALKKRLDYFEKAGCKISDHALDTICFEEATTEKLDQILSKRFQNQTLCASEIAMYKSALLLFLGREYAHRNWVQQYHLNARRNNSSRMFKQIGPNTGFDSINDTHLVDSLAKIFDKLDQTDELPKTILYSLNAKDNDTLVTMAGCFNESGVQAKIQLGSAWWFNDQKDGMMRQMTSLANMGLISTFVGMLTDSRSILSYPRHDYFRRLLCNYFGNLIDSGEYPNDLEMVGQIIQNICYRNALKYFNCEELIK